jgi:hypothetical protein
MLGARERVSKRWGRLLAGTYATYQMAAPCLNLHRHATPTKRKLHMFIDHKHVALSPCCTYREASGVRRSPDMRMTTKGLF